MTKRILLIISLFGLVAVQAQSILLFEPASAHRLEAAQPQQLKATLSAEVTVRAAGRGNPWINLSDGRDLETNRTLSGASLLEEADPTGLATGDFNEDGSPDLVVGYMSDGGLGIIILHRGNIASIYPSSSDASLGASDSPFLDSPRLIELPDPAEFLAAGDFDADGHCDLVAAARDRSRMFLLRGDGKGGLGNAEPVELPGKITALTSGEINRPDGLTDIVVAISGADGPKVIVFEGPEGAARAAPEVLDLPSEARALALGRLDDDPLIDLVVGAGRELLIVSGRDRQLSIDRDQRAEVHPAIIHRQSLSFTVESLVLGDFSGDSRLEIALMSGDGRVSLFGRKEAIGGTALARTESARWRQISALAEVVDNSTGSASLLVRARLSSLPKDNLVVLDQSRLQMQIVAFDGVSRNRGVVPTASPKQPLMVSIDADEEPVAVLPMRLNADAISDLVVLRRGHRAPSLLITPAALNFTVTSVADLPDASPGDGVCDIGTSICTLRAAIQEANASAGLDTISFSLGSGTPSIIVGGGGFGPLPLITEAVTILGNSGGATRIELNGTVAGPAATGLSISSGGATVRGLVINRFAGGEILLTNNGGNTIEGCIIGANAGGTAGFPNPADGVSVSDSPGNTIGGASAAAGNIISANGLGVHIDGPLSTGNRVQGNFIGTTLLGNAALANATGVVVSGGAANNSVGGAVGITRNVISGNKSDGVVLSSVGNLVQQNSIGVDSGTFTDLGNTGVGVRTFADGNTIGGTSALAGNIISGNDSQGVSVGSSSNLVQGNFIGTNGSGNASVPNASDGVAVPSGINNIIGGTAPGARNLISGNGGNGISLGAGSSTNLVIGNFIGVDFGGNAAIGNALSGIRIGSALNTIGGVTQSARNIISGNVGTGLLLATAEAGQNLVQGNFIGPSAAGNFAIANLSSGVSIDGAPGNMIGGTGAGARNVISGNAGSGVQIINGSMFNHLEGNYIGTDLNGVGSLPNTGSGVLFSVNASNNTVGGTAPGAGNAIAFNFIGGVVASSSALSANSILGNSIRQNTGLGIDLNANGITANDPGDGDVGANDLQNFPLLTSANSGGAGTVIVGNLNSTAGTVFRVEFFSSLSCDPAGNGEGQVFVGSTTVTTDGAGNGPVNVTLPTVVPGGRQLTATATNPAGSTSEFSPCIVVVGSAASADISVTKLANPDPVAAGSSITYTVRVTNSGPDEAIGAVLTDNIPANTTFQSLLAAPGWTCTTPPAGGAGTVNCTHPDLLSGTISSFVIAVQVGLATPNGTIITNTGSASSTIPDPNPANNSASTATLVSGSSPCVISCGSGLITVPTKDSQCGAIVKYPNLVTTGSCGAVGCVPPSDSFFPVGSSVVTCTTAGGPSCSFTVRVEDRTPPLITCPANVVQPLDPNLPSAVVNYPLPVATDNCPGRFMVCSPPAGSTFPAGVTPVSCRVTDSANNVAACSFTVTVNDTQPPGLICPANMVINSQPGQCSLTVNYPAPTVTDNLPGATATCAPPSGSAFTVGVTTVTCMATDASGNRTSCTFIVTLSGGPGQARITIPSGKSAVEFGNPVPVSVGRKPAKLKKTPCSNFTIDNVGFTPLVLSLESILRTGADVDSRKITDADDSKIFTVSLVNSDQSLTPLSSGSVVTIQPCQSRNFCARFNPSIPGLAGKTTGLSADDVVPDAVTSAIMFRQAGGGVVAVNLLGHVETGPVFINPDNPRKAPLLNMSRSGDEFILSYSVFDSNMDVKSAKYELLDASGRLVGEAFDIDLVQPIRDLNLVRGQSFGVQQRFSGASSHPEVVAARLTVTDGQKSVTATVQIGGPSTAAAALVSSLRFGGVVVFPRGVKLDDVVH